MKIGDIVTLKSAPHSKRHMIVQGPNAVGKYILQEVDADGRRRLVLDPVFAKESDLEVVRSCYLTRAAAFRRAPPEGWSPAVGEVVFVVASSNCGTVRQARATVTCGRASR